MATKRAPDRPEPAARSVSELPVIHATADLLSVAAVDLGPHQPGTTALAAERGPEPAASRRRA